jgi:hypothetical protein
LPRSWWLSGCISIGWNWINAALFGVLIAATDPVSVIAAFHEMKVERRFGLQPRRLGIRRFGTDSGNTEPAIQPFHVSVDRPGSGKKSPFSCCQNNVRLYSYRC